MGRTKLDYSNPPTADDDPEALKFKNLNWLHLPILVLPPILTVYGLFTHTLTLPTFLLGTLWYFMSGFGITAGYHRMWSHRAFEATLPVQIFLAIAGASALQGSGLWWCRNHRSHHRFTDTDKDPYNVRKGFFWAHIGWMLVNQNIKRIGKCDIGDLKTDKVLHWQHKFYLPIVLVFSIALPTYICSFWNDAWGGFLFACMARITFVHHATFFVNSLAHYSGEQGFSDHHTAGDSFITAILTLGEGYHNFHHEFPQDFRNAIRWFQYDPTKWFIQVLALFGQTYNLKRFSDNEVQKAQLQMKQRKLDDWKYAVEYDNKVENLPLMDWNTFEREVAHGQQLVVIDSIIYDVTSFVDEHPGGRTLLFGVVGKDGTDAYFNNPHQHSPAAKRFLKNLAVARLSEAVEVARSTK